MKLVIIERNGEEYPAFVLNEDAAVFDKVIIQEDAAAYFDENKSMHKRVQTLISEFLDDMGIKLGKAE